MILYWVKDICSQSNAKEEDKTGKIAAMSGFNLEVRKASPVA